jgi:enamine deaminase RidA (YjgF/YER057c/UK114 family)
LSIEARLKELGIILPEVAAPLAAYVPAVKAGDFVYTAGQLPFVDGKLKYIGVVGRDVTLEEAADAARICALNAIAAVKSVLGDLDEVEQVVKLTGWVASADNFTDQPKVINGASELVGEIFGESGKHARAAVGVNTLPLGTPVEVEMIVKVKAK